MGMGGHGHLRRVDAALGGARAQAARSRRTSARARARDRARLDRGHRVRRRLLVPAGRAVPRALPRPDRRGSAPLRSRRRRPRRRGHGRSNARRRRARPGRRLVHRPLAHARRPPRRRRHRPPPRRPRSTRRRGGTAARRARPARRAPRGREPLRAGARLVARDRDSIRRVHPRAARARPLRPHGDRPHRGRDREDDRDRGPRRDRALSAGELRVGPRHGARTRARR